MNVVAIMDKIKKEIIEEKIATQNNNPYANRRLIEYKQAKNGLVICGVGKFGIKTYNFLVDNGLKEKIVAFCDNNKTTNDKNIDKHNILPIPEAIEKFPDAVYIVTPKGYENEITRQLSGLGISIDRISIFKVEYI